MNMMTHIARPERSSALAELLRRFRRDEVEQAVDLLIEMLDAADGDAEAESATWIDTHGAGVVEHGAATAIEDAEFAGDEHDAAFTEWLTRGRHKLYAGGYEPGTRVHEDAEDDDEREAQGDDADTAWLERLDQTQHGGNVLSEDHEEREEDDDAEYEASAQPLTLNRLVAANEA